MTDWNMHRTDNATNQPSRFALMSFASRGVGTVVAADMKIAALTFNDPGDPPLVIALGDPIEVAAMAAMIIQYGREEYGPNKFQALLDQALTAVREAPSTNFPEENPHDHPTR